MSEKVIVVDGNDKEIGQRERSALTGNDRWRISIIWIENSNNEVLIMQRKADAKTNPNKWECVGGTVEAGESYLQAAHRELFEEVGVAATVTPVEKVLFDASFGKRACQIFKAIIDRPVEAFVIQETEVADIKWVPRQELWQDIHAHPENYVDYEFAFLMKIFK